MNKVSLKDFGINIRFWGAIIETLKSIFKSLEWHLSQGEVIKPNMYNLLDFIFPCLYYKMKLARVLDNEEDMPWGEMIAFLYKAGEKHCERLLQKATLERQATLNHVMARAKALVKVQLRKEIKERGIGNVGRILDVLTAHSVIREALQKKDGNFYFELDAIDCQNILQTINDVYFYERLRLGDINRQERDKTFTENLDITEIEAD